MKYSVLHTYEADVTTVDNPYNFEQQQLFSMALRINKKRRFLFVSKVLGKHLAVQPAIPLLTSHLLAYRFMEQRFGQKDAFSYEIRDAIHSQQNLVEVLEASRQRKLIAPKALTIIGFAETATALGHGFFEKFAGDVQFVHTTREHLVDVTPVICFEEEHSHASSHRVYADEALFLRDAEVVLVDDEMTTGKTNRNIIRQLHGAYPHLTTFTLVSILDFRVEAAQEAMRALEQELGITIHCVSLFTGAFHIAETGELFTETESAPVELEATVPLKSFERLLQPALLQQRSYSENHQVQDAHYYSGSGRFALTVAQQHHSEDNIRQMAEVLRKMRSDGKCLVLGTGEFMYIPMAIATKMGDDVLYHATTRSPIYAHEAALIYNKFTFPSAEFPGVLNYAYNIPRATYTDIFVIYERVMDRSAAENLYAQLQPYAENIVFVTLGGTEHLVCT